MKAIPLATAQFELTDNIDRNLEAIFDLSKKAMKADSRLIVFPECALTGYPGGDMVDLSRIDPHKVREALERISVQSSELGIFIAIGATAG
jgi:omega-amidase